MPPPLAAAPPNRPVADIFRSLSHRNYRLFFGGQGLSLVGTWMTRTALTWLVYDLIRRNAALEAVPPKVWWLGVVAFAGQIPILLFAPMAGVLVEDANRLRVLVVTQVLAMVQSLALAWLTWAGLIEMWQILALAAMQGVINAVDTPARQAFLVEIIEDRQNLSNAIALNSSMFNGARLVGPAVAGAMLAGAGAAFCFLFDGISYLAVIAALLAMRIKPREIKKRERHVWRELREGFRYAFQMAPIRVILLVLGLISIVGIPFMVLMPVFADQILHGGPRTYGFLLAASGFGALCGALYLASRHSVVGLGRVIIWACAMFGTSVVVFAFSHWLWLSLLMSFTASFGLMVHMAASNTILQTIVDDDKRARVMGIFTMSVLGLTPVGSLFSAGLVALIGTPYTVAVGGCLSLLGSLYFFSQLPKIRAVVRPIYEKAGILAPVATGIQSATDVGEAA